MDAVILQETASEINKMKRLSSFAYFVCSHHGTLVQVTCYKRKFGTGSPPLIRQKTTTLPAKLITVELRSGLPKALPLRNGRRLAHSCGYMVNVRVSPNSCILQPLMSAHCFDSLAGSGKSILWYVSHQFSSSCLRLFILSTSSTIIQEIKLLRDTGLALMGYFYFDFRDTAKQDIRGLLSSLLAQLCAKSDSCYDILSRLYSTYDAGSQQPDDDALVECLKDMLKIPRQPAIYIIVDALDECPNTSGIFSPREQVLELLEQLVGLQLPNLRICATSRPEFDIRNVLEDLASYAMSLHDESGQKIDIVHYISSFVQSDKKMGKWREEDKKLVIDTLSEKAGGM